MAKEYARLLEDAERVACVGDLEQAVQLLGEMMTKASSRMRKPGIEKELPALATVQWCVQHQRPWEAARVWCHLSPPLQSATSAVVTSACSQALTVGLKTVQRRRLRILAEQAAVGLCEFDSDIQALGDETLTAYCDALRIGAIAFERVDREFCLLCSFMLRVLRDHRAWLFDGMDSTARATADELLLYMRPRSESRRHRSFDRLVVGYVTGVCDRAKCRNPTVSLPERAELAGLPPPSVREWLHIASQFSLDCTLTASAVLCPEVAHAVA